MRTVKALTVAAGLTTFATFGLVASSIPSTGASAGVVHPCPSGMVCIYGGITNTSSIIRGYYVLGPHGVHLDQRKHLVVNQLWDRRKLTLRDRHGKPVAVIPSVDQRRVDFTKVRSLVLQKACPVKVCFVKVPQ